MDWFAQHLLAWHAENGRTELPWQHDRSPYRVWVSEIMLQQTQVATVIGYYNRFMARFPTIETLAEAPLDEVLHYWTGLGYYARARNLHKTAIEVIKLFNGEFPTTQSELEALPGIGRSTAGAIRAIAMQQSATILDGNVKRVLARFHAVPGYPGKTQVANGLWQLAINHTPKDRSDVYAQAIMDLGATICTRHNPHCLDCPVRTKCEARLRQSVSHYPERKPKSNKPLRTARFFVTSLPDHTTLLERRPTQGIWGGLWTPPERPADQSVTQFLEDIGSSMAALQHHHYAPIFRHTFTHFHLNIEPVYLTLENPPACTQNTDHWLWIKPEQASADDQKIGLSAPAVKLLRSVLKPPAPITPQPNMET